MGTSKQLIDVIEEDFKQRHPLFHKSRREALTMLTSVMLDVRSANLMELAEELPLAIGAAEHRYQYIVRHLQNEEIDTDTVIEAKAVNDGLKRGP